MKGILSDEITLTCLFLMFLVVPILAYFSFGDREGQEEEDWRIFVVLCGIPCLFSCIGKLFLDSRRTLACAVCVLEYPLILRLSWWYAYAPTQPLSCLYPSPRVGS